MLTLASADRWTEALSGRQSFTVGAEWLLFDEFEITNTQESYWALTSQYAVSNGPIALEFSGFSTNALAGAPLYVPFTDGVEFPVLIGAPREPGRVATGTAASGQYALQGPVSPTLTLGSAGTATITASYVSAVAQLLERATAEPGRIGPTHLRAPAGPGGVRRVVLSATRPPPRNSTLLDTDFTTHIAFYRSTADWDVAGVLGQYPYPVSVFTHATFSPAPSAAKPAALSGPHTWNLTFADPNRSGPFSVGIGLSTEGAVNPNTALPTEFSSQAFLNDHGIDYLLWPATASGASEITYFGATFHFSRAYQNPEWIVLSRS